MIDFDNVTLGIRSDLQNQLRRLMNSEIIKGKVAVQRAYADWRRYPQYIVPLSEASIDLIFAPAFGSNKKNATDIRLAIDALELVFTRPEIGTFILLSGDSDFSSLVLKLKEYGKYIIGVGIRESSSDLLVQNCDEYFSYSELTGLTKQSDAERVSRDPWELVVEAVSQMRTEGDVMRSDRLKQVMQEIDPTFNEKDVGFSRFSKFVTEVSQRGLLKVTKLDNGQYEIELGENANVSPAVEAAMRDEASGAAEAPAREPRRGDRRPRRPRGGGPAAGTMTLATAFEALRSALLELGAVGDEATDADQVRERMIARSGAPADPIFERTRFQRLLRQAHDANVIELAKRGEAYLLRLGTQTLEAQEEAVPAAEPTAEQPSEERRSGRGRRRRGERGGGHGGRDREGRSEEPTGEAALDQERERPVVTGEDRAAEGAKGPSRNPRFRRGSRGRGPSAGAEAPAESDTAPASPASAAPPPPPPPPPPAPDRSGSGQSRSVRLRRGSRGGPRAVAPPASERTESRAAVPQPAAAQQASVRRSPPVEEPPPASPPTEAAAPEPDAEAGSGFLRRVTSALQKAVRGPGGSSTSGGD
ncbi:MAG: hypothetical protein A2W29_13045 [Gemmatimonadetes bacterium RBG_16_66_8]|nr:MAG: hypothetical protein A2W29_13045 [Gemmatimonadetes bacterium RBG_16_66_8]